LIEFEHPNHKRVLFLFILRIAVKYFHDSSDANVRFDSASGGGLDESPHVYRRLADVLCVHQNTVNIRHWLKPLGVVMARADEYDPFKD
jgi:hypothetical protein